jgi:hypothetical protein
MFYFIIRFSQKTYDLAVNSFYRRTTYLKPLRNESFLENARLKMVYKQYVSLLPHFPIIIIIIITSFLALF